MLKKLVVNTKSSISCPKCGPNTKLIVKESSINGSQFLGCPNYPNCRHAQEIPEDMKLELLGIQRLPGF